MPRCPTCYRRLAPGMVCPRDGSEVPVRVQESPPVVPRLVPGYEIVRLLGVGGFSNVWDARREIDEKVVALKVAHASTRLARARFTKEADALSAIGAPHVPELYDRGVLDDGRPFLVMERLDGPILADMLARRLEPPDVAWVLEVAEPILRSLEAVHGKRLVHRDLKPENIFLSQASPRQAYLTDFGIVSLEPADLASVGSTGTSEHTIIGTAEYISPEQLAGIREVDARGDIYAFGVLLYELLTLRVPFTGDLASIQKGHRVLRPPRPSDFAAVPSELEDLCLECLAKDPRRRPPDVASLRSRLIRACHDAGNAPIPTHESSSSPVPLLRVDRQPVVMLSADLRSLDRTASQLVTRRKGFVARQQGLRMLCAFSGLLDEKPEQSALVTARELVEQYDARVVIHFDELTVRPGGGRRPPKVYGPSINQPDSWMPSGAFSGLLLTRAMMELLPESATIPAQGHDGFYTMAATPSVRVENRLFGRDDIQDAVRIESSTCLEERSPGLMTVIGAHGLGKSRIAHAISDMLVQGVPNADVYLLQANRRSVGHASETYRRLQELFGVASLSPGAGAHRTSEQSALLELGDAMRQTAAKRPVVVIIDDIHYADDRTLDTIEYATLNGSGIALWIVVCAHPRLLRRRPHWGERANRHHQAVLAPLSEPAAMEMAADLLRPAEFPPKAVLQKLARWTAGSPQALEQLARTLKRRGIIKQRANSESWYVATAELEQLPASPVGQWLAARQLESMPLEQAACVRVCAVLGQEFSRGELAWVQNAAERDRTATTTIDTDIGLAALASRGIVSQVNGDDWTFTQVAFQDAIYKLVAQRDRETIHRHALAFWRSRFDQDDSARVWASIARHAGFCGEEAMAADANLELGDRAARAHRFVEADLYYTAALAFLEPDDHERQAHALGGRGPARYRMQRIQDSIGDLRSAQAHARAMDDGERLAHLMLEEATALDWAWRFSESAERVREARAVVVQPISRSLEARFLMSEGRSLYRSANNEQAIVCLERAVELGREVDDVETCIISLLLMGVLLAYSNRFEAAEARFDEVVELCTRTGDRLHLCAAHGNRSVLWMETHAFAQLESDLRHTIQIAREIGQPALERVGAHNLAEYLFRCGESREALALARRGYDLRRFLSEQTAADSLLLARILTIMEETDEARAMLEEARSLATSGESTPLDEIYMRALELTLDKEPGPRTTEWDAVVCEGRERLPVGAYLEVLHLRACAAARTGQQELVRRMLAEAEDYLPRCPIWTKPFAELASRVSLRPSRV